MSNTVALTRPGVYQACSDSNVSPCFTDIVIHSCVYNNVKGIYPFI